MDNTAKPMEVIEFHARTDHRNLMCNIRYLVKERLSEAAEALQLRKQKLCDILEFENLYYDEELVLLLNKRVQESARKRVEWIGAMRIERERAEEELLKLKNTQRELENCEEWRHLQSKEMLLETKQAQRYQIEEKKALLRKEKEIEVMWLEALRRLTEERERQEVYEQKLRMAIAGSNQDTNAQQDETRKLRHKAEIEALQLQLAEDDKRAINIERKYQEAENSLARAKKLAQAASLQEQMEQNAKNLKLQLEFERLEGICGKASEDQEIVKELNQKLQERMRNREWHRGYLEHALKEKRAISGKEQQLNVVLLGTGCVLQQHRKQPYGKEVR